jgi:hypothetical protein
MAGPWYVRVPHRPYSPGLAIADFYLLGRFRQQFSVKTLDNEEDVLETITEILSELSKKEMKRVFVHWK